MIVGSTMLAFATSRRMPPLLLGSFLLWLGCNDPMGPVLEPGQSCSGQSTFAIVTFVDTNLEVAIKTGLAVDAQADVTCGELSGLRELLGAAAGIESLAGMQNLTSLRTLTLDGNSVSDIDPLSGLTSLSFLSLSSNSISDIAPLSSLTDLTFLSLNSNSISDIGPLSGLTSLTFLFLDINSISNISPLSGLTSLADLNLGFNPNVVDIQPLLDNPGLAVGDRVDLMGTSVSCQDVAALEAQQVTVTHSCTPVVLLPTQLCSDNPDFAIATFDDTNLESAVRSALGLGAQDDLTCGVVEGLTELDGQQVSSLMGAQNLPSLTTLGLAGGAITDIGPLSGLTSLTTLTMPFNVGLGDLSPLSGLTSLQTLSLDHNSTISEIGPLSGLTSLTTLFLGHNSISELSPLSELTSLTLLQLHENAITDVSALSGLTSLASLGLDGNLNLSDIQPLLANTELGVGDAVDIRSTSVSCADVAALDARGLSVSSDFSAAELSSCGSLIL